MQLCNINLKNEIITEFQVHIDAIRMKNDSLKGFLLPRRYVDDNNDYNTDNNQGTIILIRR